MKKQILVLGSVNADHVLRVSQFPRPGETITGHSYNIISGGKGANQAVACARLGGSTQFMACVGDDGFGHQVIRQFVEDGINTETVEPIAGVNTGVALIFVDQRAENFIGIAAEANNRLNREFVIDHQKAIKDADYLLTQLETPEDGIITAAKIARENQTFVVLNPAPAKPLSDDLLSNIDMITPNQTEAEMLTGVVVQGQSSASQAAQVLHDKGISIVIITMGSQGAFTSMIVEGQLSQEMIAPYRVEPVDTTAAGDTFNGGLLVSLCEGSNMTSAVRFANACGALSVMRHGAQTSIPSRVEVETFMSVQTESHQRHI
ncbi:ribokinase [Endozoicomonas ascidiicola]|uniref:ribokinase n=1 Tax=Endozoicomonas ascidiicola TaxID=1698521 RepID=UPI00082D585A|nr:ribokinase [Endozoicomonas ascidiicola]